MAVCWLSAPTYNLLLIIPNPVACLWRTAVRDLLFPCSPLVTRQLRVLHSPFVDRMKRARLDS